MSGCGFHKYKPHFKFDTFKENTDSLEKAHKSNSHIIQLATDYINQKNGITTAAKELFAPVTAATDTARDVLTTTAKKIAEDQTALTKSNHADIKNINIEVVERISKQAEIQKQYADAVLKQVESKIDERTKETLENISKTAEDIRDDVMRVRTANVNEIQQVKERMIEQDEHLKDLHKEMRDEQSGTREILSKHTSTLEEIQAAIRKDFEELPNVDASTSTEPSTSVEAPSTSKKLTKEELKKIINDKMMDEYKAEFNIRGSNREDLEVVNKALDKIINDKRDLDPVKYTKNTFIEKYNALYGESAYNQLDKSSGSGLVSKGKKKKNLERVKLLLASHKAGNSAGVNEFMDLLKKLLKQNEISKSDYENFLKMWST
jgi:hypothetical protein